MNIDNQTKLLANNKDGSKIYATTGKELIKLNIKNWNKNRPPDRSRIPEIIDLFNQKEYIDGFIYLFKCKDIYYCYDGIHRLEALREYYNNYSNIKNHKVFVHIFMKYNEYKIEEKFKQINKCIPVPEIYTEAAYNLDFKDKVLFIVDKTYEDFQQHFSSSKKPHKIHENRDCMVDKITSFLEKYDLVRYHTKDQLYDLCIIQFNDYMLNNYFEKIDLSLRQKTKCIENKCYLFISKDWINLLENFYSKNILK